MKKFILPLSKAINYGFKMRRSESAEPINLAADLGGCFVSNTKCLELNYPNDHIPLFLTGFDISMGFVGLCEIKTPINDDF